MINYRKSCIANILNCFIHFDVNTQLYVSISMLIILEQPLNDHKQQFNQLEH